MRSPLRTFLLASVAASALAPTVGFAQQASEVPEAFIGTFMPHGLDGRSYVDAHIALFREAMLGCYETSLDSSPTLEGLMLMRVYVASDGDVIDVDIMQNRTGSTALASCVESALEAVAMRPSNRDNVSITLPVTFRLRASDRQVATAASPQAAVSRR